MRLFVYSYVTHSVFLETAARVFPFHRGWLVAARILAYYHIIEDSLFETSFHEYTSGKPCQILRKQAGHVQIGH
jgi:hypothetical protein